MALRALALLVLLSAPSYAQKAMRAEIEAAFAGKEGCFLVYDLRFRQSLFDAGSLCERRLPACSTFKVALAAMAFDAGALKNEGSGFEWDKVHRPIESWNKDHDAASWMKDSVVWFSQRLTPLLGKKKIERYLKNFDYGTRDMSGGLDKAWLTVAPFLTKEAPTLRISPREQARFLSRLWRKELALSEEALELTKKITFLQTTPGGWDLHGKTGSGFVGGVDGPRLGWFVARLGKKDEELIAVTAFVDKKRSPGGSPFGGAEARAITQRLLEKMGRW